VWANRASLGSAFLAMGLVCLCWCSVDQAGSVEVDVTSVKPALRFHLVRGEDHRFHLEPV
jgi:hypothetical protein